MTGNSEIEFNLICKAVKVFLNGKILSEMEEFLKLVGVCIELTVEILCDKPVRLEKLFGTCKTERAEKQALKLVVGNSVFLARADIVKMIPEIVAEIALHILVAQICEQSARILNRAPFKHAVNRNVEHNRVHIFKDVGVENTRLTH